MLALSFKQLNGGIPQVIGSIYIMEELYLGYKELMGGILKENENLSYLNIFQLESSGISGSY